MPSLTSHSKLRCPIRPTTTLLTLERHIPKLSWAIFQRAQNLKLRRTSPRLQTINQTLLILG